MLYCKRPGCFLIVRLTTMAKATRTAVVTHR